MTLSGQPNPSGQPGQSGDPAPAQPSPGTGQGALLEEWQSIYSGFRRLSDRLLAEVEMASGMDPPSFQALWFLMTTPQQSAPMNELARVLGFSTAGTTKVVDRLSEAGYVRRRPSPADRRMIFAELTAAGAQAAAEVSAMLAESLRHHLVEPLGADRVTALATALRSLDRPGDAEE